MHACLQPQNPEPRQDRAGAPRELHVSTAGRGGPEQRVGFWGESTQRRKGGTMFGFPKHSKFTSSIPQLTPVVPFPPFLITHMLLRSQEAVQPAGNWPAQTGSIAPGRGHYSRNPPGGPLLSGISSGWSWGSTALHPANGIYSCLLGRPFSCCPRSARLSPLHWLGFSCEFMGRAPLSGSRPGSQSQIGLCP